MVDDHDEAIECIAAAMRPLPMVRAEAKVRLLVAVAAERARDGERLRRPHRARWWMIGGLGAALAAGAAGMVLRDGAPASTASSATRASYDGGSPARLAANSPAAAVNAPLEVHLALRAPLAARVQVAGDFNGWNPREAPMSRDAASGVWSVSLTLAPGRHVYAFVVDDSLWVRDPRAPMARDADFGRPGSVLLVGRP